MRPLFKLATDAIEFLSKYGVWFNVEAHMLDLTKVLSCRREPAVGKLFCSGWDGLPACFELWSELLICLFLKFT